MIPIGGFVTSVRDLILRRRFIIFIDFTFCINLVFLNFSLTMYNVDNLYTLYESSFSQLLYYTLYYTLIIEPCQTSLLSLTTQTFKKAP